MSSYLVALIISDFQCKHEIVQGIGDDGKVEVGVCGRPSVVSAGELDYALNVSKNVIEFYEKFYGVKYPLPKCGLYQVNFYTKKYIKIQLFQDHVAIPDFDAGAMENWGLITYRQNKSFI